MLRDKNHKSILMRPLERLSGLPSPYNFLEGLGCLYRESHGPSRRGVRIPCLPKDGLINKGIEEELTLGFVGDILDTKGLPAEIGEDVVRFFDDCDAVVGNFESVITDLPGHGTSVRHVPQIIDALEKIFPPQSTYLSIANNHAGDYPPEVLFDSVRKLEERGFNVFGWNERPFADIGDSVRIVGATDWSNASCDSVYMLNNKKTPLLKKENAHNILFPHWGYELELYPRRSMMRKSKSWIDQGFDVVIAHHGHTPRAIYAVENKRGGPSTLVADSLGDFVCGFTPEWYHYGIVMKIGLGKDAADKRAVGRLCWEFCETRPVNGVVRTSLRRDFPTL
jgi:hypothetical protein